MAIDALVGEEAAFCLGLFLLSVLQEELGMIAGGILVTERGLPAALVALVLVLGLVAGDWGIFALGVLARRHRRLKRWLRSDLAGRSRAWLDRHLLAIVAVARLFPGPGILLPAFAGLGLIGVSFPRFALGTALTAAVYAPIALYLTIVYGNVVAAHTGWWAWPALILALFGAFAGPWAKPWRRRVERYVGLERRHGPPDA